MNIDKRFQAYINNLYVGTVTGINENHARINAAQATGEPAAVIEMVCVSHVVVGIDREHGDQELYAASTEDETRRWLQAYTRFGNWGGYDGFAIVTPDKMWIHVMEREDEYA